MNVKQISYHAAYAAYTMWAPYEDEEQIYRHYCVSGNRFEVRAWHDIASDYYQLASDSSSPYFETVDAGHPEFDYYQEFGEHIEIVPNPDDSPTWDRVEWLHEPSVSDKLEYREWSRQVRGYEPYDCP